MNHARFRIARSAFFAAGCLLFAARWAAAETYEEIVLADKPIAYYRFNETGGNTAKDATGNGRDGTYKGEVVLGQPAAHPALGTSVALGGEQARVHIARHKAFKFGTGDLSVEFWFLCHETVATRGDILSFKGEGKDFALFKPNGNTNLLSYAKPGRAFQAQTDPLSLGVWHHAVYVRHENVDQWYIDGELSGTATGNVMDIDMNADILIGANHRGRSDLIDDYCLFSGSVDELAFYDKALAPEQVRAHYREGLDGDSSN